MREKKKCKGVNYYPDIDECAFAQLDYCEIIDLEQMLCYCIGYFNKSTLVLWHQPQCLSSWADVSGCCVLTVMNSVDRDTQHGALMRLIIKYDLLLKKKQFLDVQRNCESKGESHWNDKEEKIVDCESNANELLSKVTCAQSKRQKERKRSAVVHRHLLIQGAS